MTKPEIKDAENPCKGCDGYGVLGFYLNGALQDYSDCERCKGSGTEPKEPDNLVPYVCEKCKATGVKLWREYQTLLDQQHLLCAICAAVTEDKNITGINENGQHSSDVLEGMKTTQIGYMVPAILTELEDTFWGLMSVPQDRWEWWVALPTLKEKESPMIDHALGILRTRLRDEGIDPDEFEMVINSHPQSPWIMFAFKPIVRFEDAKPHCFALWKRTGAIHTLINGAVQDPAIFPSS